MQSAGNWNESATAGSFYRNLNNNRSNDNNNSSFRACDYFSKPDTTKVDTGDIGISTPASAKYSDVETTLHSHITLEQISNLDNLYSAFLEARKSKRFKKRIYDFENNIANELQNLKDELSSGLYIPREPKQFMIYEPKPRFIAAPDFRDSVVQHAIYRLVYQIFDKSFIYESYGCRKGKGNHRASDKLQKQMRASSGEDYFLQIDIRKYYYNVKHSLLRTQLAKKVQDERVLNLMMLFVGDGDKGLFIGSLLSQFYGLVYLNQFDHWVKRFLKVKNYVRYVDDMCFTGFSTKDEAKAVYEKVVKWLSDTLELVLSKWQIRKIKRGINFVGYRTWRSIRFVRKRSLYNFSKALRANKLQSLISIVGNAKRTATYAYFMYQLKTRGVNI